MPKWPLKAGEFTPPEEASSASVGNVFLNFRSETASRPDIHRRVLLPAYSPRAYPSVDNLFSLPFFR